jgi:hypothetical protein
MRAAIIFATAVAVLEEKKKCKFLSANRKAELIEAELARRGLPRVMIGEKSTDDQKTKYFDHQRAMCLVTHVMKYPREKLLAFAQLTIDEPYLNFPGKG